MTCRWPSHDPDADLVLLVRALDRVEHAALLAQDVERDVAGSASREHGRDDVCPPVTCEIAVDEAVEAAAVARTGSSP